MGISWTNEAADAEVWTRLSYPTTPYTTLLDYQVLTQDMQAFIGIQVLYYLNATLTKTSILLFFHRIFGIIRKFRHALWLSAFIVVAYWIATTTLTFMGCTPFAKNWDMKHPGHCVNLVSFFRWSGICNMLIDVLILFLPLPVVWRLNMPIRQRLELSGIFLLGVFVCGTSVMRITAYHSSQLKDSTFSGVGSMTWSIVEQGVGIVCACLPTLRPLITSAKTRSSEIVNTKEQSTVARRHITRWSSHSAIAVPEASARGPSIHDGKTVLSHADLELHNRASKETDV